MKAILLTLFAVAAALPQAIAQEADSTRATVDVGEGRLESLLTDAQKQAVRHLTVTGTLADEDYTYLRSGLLAQLDTLDLSDADIDTIPSHAFYCDLKDPISPHKQWVVIFPKSLAHLADNALCQKYNIRYVLSGRYPTLGKNVYQDKPGILYVNIDITPDNAYLKIIDGNIYSSDGKIVYYCMQGWGDIIPGVEVLYGNAFENCEATNEWDILLPKTIDSIGDRAFANNEIVFFTRSLNKYGHLNGLNFICEAALPPKLGKDVFTYDGDPHISLTSLATLCVPDESIELYKNTEGWNLFKDIKGISSLISGIKRTEGECNLKVCAGIGGITLQSDKEIKSVKSFGTDGKVQFSMHPNANAVNITKPNLHFTIIKVNYADGTSETIKLKP